MFGFFFKYIYNSIFGLFATKKSDDTTIRVVSSDIWSDHFCEKFTNASPELTDKIKNLLSSLPNLSYIVDVNANVGEIGLYTALCLQNIHNEKCIDVIMIEPDETKVEFIKKMIELNNLVNCIVINCAVSDKKTIGKLSFDIEKPGKSLVIEDTGSENHVVIDTIDYIAKDLKIGLLHLDNNDQEYKALLGASETLDNTEYIVLNMNEESKNSHSRDNERKFLKVKKFIEVPDEDLKNKTKYEIYKNQLE